MQPSVSTLNSMDGRIKANAAIVPAGTGGSVTVFVSDTANVILDINGYFVAPSVGSELAFYPITPCRLADARNPNATLGGPVLAAAGKRDFPVSGNCGIPAGALAYAFNMTAVPSGMLGFLSACPAGSPEPGSSTINAPTGAITANTAIVPAGTGGSISIYTTDVTHLIIDVTGYFAPPGASSMGFFTLVPCRVADTRLVTGSFGGPILAPSAVRKFPVPSSSCQFPAGAKAYSLNATLVPPTALGFLTLWGGGAQPASSTLNAMDGAITANAAPDRRGRPARSARWRAAART